MQLLRNLCRLSEQERLRGRGQGDQRAHADQQRRRGAGKSRGLSHDDGGRLCGRRSRARRHRPEAADGAPGRHRISSDKTRPRVGGSSPAAWHNRGRVASQSNYLLQ